MIELQITIFTLLVSNGNSFPIFNINSEVNLSGSKGKIDENHTQKSFKNLKMNFEDAYASTDELIKKHGYPVETHSAMTKDFYILKMHRIPKGKHDDEHQGDKNSIRPVVFLQHGILGSSADWVLQGPEKSFAYILADAGYDVWMGNVRGNTYSRNHTCLDPVTDAEKFWDFSWHEIGSYDLPAMIDYVLEKTNNEKLFYAGHSQGTTAFYVMTSVKQEYNKKIRAQFSMAPVAYMNHIFSPFWVAKCIGLNEFLPRSDLIADLAAVWCSDDSISQFICRNALFAITGFNREQTNDTLLPVIFGHSPAGSSTKQFLHFGQLVRSGKFQRYDNGYLGNIKKYGSLNPPSYDLSKSTAPAYLFYSTNDWLNSEEDVLKLESSLGNVKGKFLNPDPMWNHMDHIYGIDANNLIYSRILNLMKRH